VPGDVQGTGVSIIIVAVRPTQHEVGVRTVDLDLTA
jgi:hypothetical protein